MSDVVTAKVAAARVGVSPKTLGDWQRVYGLTPCGNRGRALLYTWADVCKARDLRDANVTRTQTRRPRPPCSKERTRVSMALDVEDLAHITNRGVVTLEDWTRVCRGRFRAWPPTTETLMRAYERWKYRLRQWRIPFSLEDVTGGDLEHGRTGETALIRFDWENALRWTKRVLD